MAFAYHRSDEPRKISESLDRIAGRLGAPTSGSFNALFARWGDLVGATVAAHTHPVSLSDGKLVVAVDEPAWATHLQFLEADLRARIEAVTGPDVVRELIVRVRPSGSRR